MVLNDREKSPRPDFYRKEWIDLNGEWSFAFDDKQEGIARKWFRKIPEGKKIKVPFCYQCKESGIGEKEIHKHLWYEKAVPLTPEMKEKRLWLHFGAADQNTKVWINGMEAGIHKGGFTPFSFSVSEYIAADDEQMRITVYCNDGNDEVQVRGKQHWNKETDRCWYTPTSGIWQNVWMEMTGEIRLERIAVTPDIESKVADARIFLSDFPQSGVVKWSVSLEGRRISEGQQSITGKRDRFLIPVRNEDVIDNRSGLWEPSHPVLYNLTVELWEEEKLYDKIETYFGMRKIECRDGVIYLNHVPLYQKLVLDQGYWKDTLMTPRDSEALLKDVLLVKEMGFDGVRKHQKLEDPRFLYYADKVGLLVWEEIPSGYEFSDVAIRELLDTCVEMVERDYNHPCIITWVPFNESWGIRDVFWDERQQHYAESLYHLLHAMDHTRLVSTNDGWEAVRADMIGIHDYENCGKKLAEKFCDRERLLSANAVDKMILSATAQDNGEPVFLSEFGGIAVEDGDDTSWGYHEKAKNSEELLEKMKELFDAVSSISYLRGYCYTQLTDVEQETNGIVDADRRPKLDIKKFREIIQNSGT